VGVVAWTVGEVAGGVTLEVMMVGGGRAWVLVSAVTEGAVVEATLWVVIWATIGVESDAVEEVEGLCSCL
jgi:hypothetical protein